MRIKAIRPIAPEVSRCIEVDSPDRLFAAGGKNGRAVLTHNSVAQRNIVFSCIMRPDHWRFLGIDLKKVELSVYRAYSNVVLGIATTLEDALTVMRFAQQTMMKRYESMEQLGVNNFLELPNRGQALMVMVDEAGELLGSSGVKALSEDTYIPNLNGRRNLGEIELGDFVFDNHGNVCRVEDKYEPEFQEQFDLILRDEFSVDTGKVGPATIRTGGDHYWVVTCPRGEEHILKTGQLFEEMKLGHGEGTWKIKRVSRGIEGAEQNLPIESATLGKWLRGETLLDGKIQELFGEELATIPAVYLYAPSQEREALLNALLGKENYFITSDLYQVQGIQRLIASLGYRAVLEQLSSEGKATALVKITVDRGASEWFEIERVEPIKASLELKRLYCLRVDSPDSQFLCSENFVPTHNTDEGKEQDKLKGEASMIIGSIARLGRAAGVHLVIATQRPDATLIPGETKANLGVRINCGRSDSNASSMILGNGEGTRVKANPRGRLYLSIYGRGDHGQGFFAEPNWIDEWLAAKGLNPDGSPLSTKKSRLAKLTDFSSEFGEDADLDAKEGVDNAAVIEKIREEEENGDAPSEENLLDDDDDWGFLDDEEENAAKPEPISESGDEAEKDASDQEIERNDGWDTLDLGKGGTDTSRPEDDWDDFMNKVTEGNFDEDPEEK